MVESFAYKGIPEEEFGPDLEPLPAYPPESFEDMRPQFLDGVSGAYYTYSSVDIQRDLDAAFLLPTKEDLEYEIEYAEHTRKGELESLLRDGQEEIDLYKSTVEPQSSQKETETPVFIAKPGSKRADQFVLGEELGVVPRKDRHTGQKYKSKNPRNGRNEAAKQRALSALRVDLAGAEPSFGSRKPQRLPKRS